jgi:hypothetical protein
MDGKQQASTTKLASNTEGSSKHDLIYIASYTNKQKARIKPQHNLYKYLRRTRSQILPYSIASFFNPAHKEIS